MKDKPYLLENYCSDDPKGNIVRLATKQEILSFFPFFKTVLNDPEFKQIRWNTRTTITSIKKRRMNQ